MKTFVLVLLCAATATFNLKADNIVWVSFSSGDDTPSAGAAGAGFTQAPDIGYTSLLEANGHTVTRFVTKNDPDASDATYLNSFDLIIVGRGVDSSNYQQANETLFWNSTITQPLISMSGYILRNSRLGFTTGGTVPDTTSTISLSVLNPGHPIFSGIALNTNGVMLNSYAQIALSPVDSATQRGISVNTDPLAGGGMTLATVGTPGDPAFNGMVIGEWAAGSTMGDGTADVLGGHRLVFLSGSREADGASSQTAGIFDLVGDGSQMFLNAVNYMEVPEPTTAALLALGGFALILRRRQS